MGKDGRRRAGLSGIQFRFTEVANSVFRVTNSVGEVIQRTAASAGELVSDRELRLKAAGKLITGASRGLQGLQRGLESTADNLARRVQRSARDLTGVRRIQAVLQNVEKMVQEMQRNRQMKDLEDELEYHRKLPVDIQIGRQVYEDMPQEIRSRLWYILLEAPELAKPLRPISGPRAQQSPSSKNAGGPSSSSGVREEHSLHEQQEEMQQPQLLEQLDVGPSGGSPEALAPTGAGSPPSSPGPHPSSSGVVAAEPSPVVMKRRQVPDCGNVWNSSSDEECDTQEGGAHERTQMQENISMGPFQEACEQGASHTPDEDIPDLADLMPHDSNRAQTWTNPLHQDHVDQSPQATSSSIAAEPHGATCCLGEASHLPAGANDNLQTTTSYESEWEMVSDNVPSVAAHGELEALETVKNLARRISSGHEGQLEGWRQAQKALFEAMAQVPWIPGEGIPDNPQEESQFAVMVNITAGQEHVDEIITRDINRTFPEHPFFSGEHGQQALFKVLKAYSLHDVEVGYCQGMAFAAGVLLMYLPDEMAYRLFCCLMDPEGSNLRRLYLPGLVDLKVELAAFDLLLSRYIPAVYRHLQDYGIPPVLYASQWLMTVFCCPFPASFAARVIDVMLQEGGDMILLRVAMSIMEECASELMDLDDFEGIITHLKVQPLKWQGHQTRRIINRAIDSYISDEDILEARSQAAADMARLSRNSSRRHNTDELDNMLSGSGTASKTVSPMGSGELALGDPEGDKAELDAAYMAMMMELNLLMPGFASEDDESLES